MTQQSLISELPRRRIWLWGALLVVIAIAGIRFSDGSMLLAISRGATVADPAFKSLASQYVWDSPLKVFLLKALPARLIPISLVFVFLSALPAFTLLAKERTLLWLACAMLFFTPAIKVSMQNVGLGDGLMFVLILLAVYSRNDGVIAAAFVLLGLWHPQQSFFIAVSFLLSHACYRGGLPPRRVVTVAVALAVALGVYLLYRSMLGFTYGGRGAYMVAQLKDFAGKNILFAPVAFAPIVLWMVLIAPRPMRGQWILYAWLVVLAGLSVVTADVTRVMTVVSMPIVLMGAMRLIEQEPIGVSNRVLIVTAVLISLIPPYSWSGMDIWLWPDLIWDLQKWHVFGK